MKIAGICFVIIGILFLKEFSLLKNNSVSINDISSLASIQVILFIVAGCSLLINGLLNLNKDQNKDFNSRISIIEKKLQKEYSEE